MIKKFFFAILVGLMTIVSLSAQNQKDYTNDQRILMTIGNHPVTVSEYMGVYSKNNLGEGILDKKTPEAYLSLYTDFKIKVLEADAQQLDTCSKFSKELEGYRKQLSDPYFQDKDKEEQLMEEAYQFMQEDLRASHILVLCDEYAEPKDTLIAYKKIEKLYNRLIKGEDFNKVAEEFSEDPSARDREAQGQFPFIPGNRGDLGYFTVFNMIYPFEKASYAVEEGRFSKIFRTPIGYHIVKVVKRFPAKGTITASHIFFKTEPQFTQQQIDSVLKRANEAYQKLQNGDSWSSVVSKMSDDKQSASNDGQLQPFSINRMVPEFIDGILSIKTNGDYTKPIKTSFGYHIIRLDKIDPIPSFEEAKPLIKKRISNDQRAQILKEFVVSKIKNKYGFELYAENLSSFLAVCDTVSFNEAKWEAKSANKLNFNMFKIGDSLLSVHDFAKYVAQKQTPHMGGSYKDMVKKIKVYHRDWIHETCTKYEEDRLGLSHPEYAHLLQEYREGMLLFEIMDKEVWSRSMTDSIGLQMFFDSQREQYMWGERRHYTEMTFLGFENAKATEKALSQVMKQLKKGVSKDVIKSSFEEKGIKVSLLGKKVEKGVNADVDALWEVPMVNGKNILKVLQQTENKFKILEIDEKISPEPKELRNVRGAVTASYQTVLEEKWMNDLRKKYPVTKNQAVYREIILQN